MIDPNRQCLAQGTELLQALTDAQYAEPRGDWAPVGAQYRHVLDHYQCFLDGLEGDGSITTPGPAIRIWSGTGRSPSRQRRTSLPVWPRRRTSTPIGPC